MSRGFERTHREEARQGHQARVGGAAESRLTWGRGRDTSGRTSPSSAPAPGAQPPATPHLLLGLHSLPPAGNRGGCGPSAAQGEAQLHLGGPLQAPPPSCLPSYHLSTSPAARGGGRGVHGEVKSQAASPGDRSPLSRLPILLHQHLSRPKGPDPMGDPRPLPLGSSKPNGGGAKHTHTQTGPRQTQISRHDKCKQWLSALRAWGGKA